MKTESTTIKSKALFSDDRMHRLLLRKEWDKTKPTAMIVTINPTGSSDTINHDTTTMLIINNISNLGYGAVNIVNLYSIITPKLTMLGNSDEDLLHEENDTVIEQYAEKSDIIVIAWGCIGGYSQRIRDRQAELLECLEPYADKLWQIGEKGYHPLTPVVRNKWELQKYDLEVEDNDEDHESE